MSRLQGGGPISISDINIELRRPWNSPFSWNDGRTRQLAGAPNGGYPISNFFGKQLYSDYGTPMGRYCSNFNLFETYSDGNGGSFSNVIEWNSPGCGYVPPPPPPPAGPSYPPRGTLISQFCSGTTLVQDLHDGSGGSYRAEFPNHQSCYIDWGGQG